MATLNSNVVFLSIDGVDVSAYWTDELGLEESNSTVEITAGSGQTHVQRASGLSDTSLDLILVYDDTDLPLYRAKLVKGTTYNVIYGPEGNTSGKPKFQCDMVLETKTGPNKTIAKDMVSFELSFVGADTPTATIEGGSVF